MSSDENPPKYADLPTFEATGDAHAWDVWGRDDQLGAINLLTAERALAASRLVQHGRVINLNLPLNLPNPAFGSRKVYEHQMYVRRGGRDDSLDGFYLQCSTQLDGLRHIRYREFGYFGGLEEEDVDVGKLGMENFAEHGIVGRGVLIDVERFMQTRGTAIDPEQKFEIDGTLIEEIAGAQRVDLQPADILMLRTGWLAWYLSLDQEKRTRLSTGFGEGWLAMPGVDPHRETAAWLWDHQIALAAADNFALEALPVDPAVGFQHRRLIPLLGIPIGEFWFLENLAADCAADGTYESMVVVAPLNLPGGVGSPANAYAIK
ncbi:MAG TPA: cyclase family protein [Dehalococcoidia bacterium]|nr:cyclase family protein [Dehalococcoidia bacterium]